MLGGYDGDALGDAADLLIDAGIDIDQVACVFTIQDFAAALLADGMPPPEVVEACRKVNLNRLGDMLVERTAWESTIPEWWSSYTSLY